MKRAPALALLALTGCGRIGFGLAQTTGDGGGNDGNTDSGADAAPPRACRAGLADTCGPTQSSSCCESPLVPGGTFVRSYDVASDGMEPNGGFTAKVSDFRLDKYDVTVGRFRQFVAAGMGTQAAPPAQGDGVHPNIAGSGWDSTWNTNLPATSANLIAALKCQGAFQTWTDAPGGNESRPINCVDWYDAMAFCAWDGGFLPTEAEWNYAAAGGSEQRAYPWSNPPGSLVIDNSYLSYSADLVNCGGDGDPGCNLADLLVVGTKPAGDGKWGQSDLAGEVWVWVLDSYVSPYPQNPCVDCANLTPTTNRTHRGGTFEMPASNQRTGQRDLAASPELRSEVYGIRCARAP